MPKSYNQKVIKSVFVLKMIDGLNAFNWEVDEVKITSEPNYRFISTNIAEYISQSNNSIIELRIRKYNLDEKILTRTVLFEKKGNFKKEEEDPMMNWIFSKSFHFSDTRDFILTTKEENSPIRNCWSLSECVLLGYKTHEVDCESGEITMDSVMKITIRPKTMFQYS